MELDAVAGPDDRTCRICGTDISRLRSDAQTCSDLHKKQWQRQRAKMLDDVLPGVVPDNSVSRDVTLQSGPAGMSAIGAAGAASRRLNRARNGRPRVIPGGQFGVYDMRPSWVTPVASRAGDDLDWAKLAEASGDYR